MKTPQEFCESYSNAVRRASVDGFTKLFEENVRIFDMWEDWSMAGRDSCRDMAAEWFSSLGPEHVRVTFSDVEIIEASESALLTSFVRFAGHGADGTELRFLDERMTVYLRRQPSGEWLVAHQHMSGPVGFQDMKVKLVKAPSA